MTNQMTIITSQWRQWIVAILVLSTGNGVVWAQNSCQELTCLNGGFCSGTDGVKCLCPPTFTGPTCAEKTSMCIASTGKCFNGVPCSADLNGCDCSAATSPFAGYMCKEPATEYCSEGTFCTNGGTCRTNLGEQVLSLMPGIGEIDCVCPPETEGNHCETLKFAKVNEQSTSTDIKKKLEPTGNTNTAKEAKTTAVTNKSPHTIWMSVLAGFLGISGLTMAVIAYRSKRPTTNYQNSEDTFPLGPMA